MTKQKKMNSNSDTQTTRTPVDDEWTEIPSTTDTRWYRPGLGDDESGVLVGVKERQTRSTRVGERPFYVCEVLDDDSRDSGETPLVRGQPLIIWESAGLKDLQRFLGQEVRIVPAGKSGRKRVFRFFQRGMS
jgi:hypothetical protein